MKKKLLFIKQKMDYENSVCGLIFLVTGAFLSYKKAGEHLGLLLLIMIAFCLNAAGYIIRAYTCREEKFDEMARENLYKASQKALVDLQLLCVVTIGASVIKSLFSIDLSWEKYFTLTPMSCVLIIVGFQYLMTGFHFKRLERD